MEVGLEDGAPAKLPPLAWLVAFLGVAVVAGALAGAATVLVLGNSDSGGNDQPAARSAATNGSDGGDAVVQAVAKAVPGTVIVVNEIAPKAGLPTGGLGAGAGFVVDERGFVVTNAHIVQDPGKLTVVLPDGERRSATLVASDAPFTDLAVVRIGPGGLKPLQLGKSEDLRLGETVVAIGSPDFDYDNSVTRGVVSGLQRRKLLQGVMLEDLIQTDAAINLGNSGGPLINLQGEVIGINTFRDVGADDDLEAISFAISSRTLRPIVQAMIERGKFPRPYFGIEHQDGRQGALVRQVFDSSPAAKAGMRPGDVIVRIGRTDLNETSTFITALAHLGSSDRVAVTVVRDGRSQELTLEATPR